MPDIPMPPEPDAKEDRARHLLKAAAGLVPGAASAFEILEMMVGDVHSKRAREFSLILRDALLELDQRVGGVEARLADEAFRDVVLHALRVALRTRREEKRAMLKNVLLNAALPGAPSEDLQHIFLTYLDDLTPSHLALLAFLRGPRQWFRDQGREPPRAYAGGLMTAVEHAFQDWQRQRDFVGQLVDDLHRRGLVTNDKSILGTTMADPMGGGRLTPLGSMFVAFVSAPTQPSP